MNLTISVPGGTTNHGNPQLLCFPAAWTDIVTFLVTNYFAHAASVLPEPGAAPRRTVALIFAALILPISGVSRAVSAIWRHAAFESKNPVKRAARSRALGMVMRVPKSGRYLGAMRTVRTWGEPQEADSEVAAPDPGRQPLSEISTFQEAKEESTKVKVSDISTTKRLQTDNSSESRWWEVASGYEPIPKHCSIHGEYWLNDEYYLAFVPAHANLAFARDSSHEGHSSASRSGVSYQKPTIPCSYNAIQAFIGLAQAMWAIITIYQARGDQIQHYGYAAFGLTVVPYALMSVVNGVANLVTPQYATMFLIRTPAMTEAEQRGKGFFKAALDVDLFEVPATAVPSKWTPVVKNGLLLLLGLIPLAIIGGISGFQAGNSTSVQRGFTMAWLIVGVVLGFALLSVVPDPGDPKEEAGKKKTKKMHRSIKQYLIDDAACESSAPDLAVISLTLLCSPPAIGGMVIVKLMISQYGICSQIG
ncbi:MAG: hypothetical protein M1820_010457 [Bogoriella megaspora]|nr:MAG: hypothetical protein M1820_010457 [Bogoriella megaspora]